VEKRNEESKDEYIVGRRQKKLQTEEQHEAAEKDHQQIQGLEKWGTRDVLGQPAEPICSYYRCHHNFSLHGTRTCRCKHPMNKTLGIFVRYH
jgi:hypothetical protein